MAKWWKDREALIPGSLIKIPATPRLYKQEAQQVPSDDSGSVTDDDSDEFDDVELPERGPDD